MIMGESAQRGSVMQGGSISHILSFAVLAQKRHHYVVINNNISQYCLRVKEQGISASGIESMWKASAFCLKGIEEHIDSLFKRNNAMRNLLNIAFAFLVAAIVFATLSMVALAVISVFVV